MEILGIDIGGSAIKGAPVDVITGKLQSQRYRIETPQRYKPQVIANYVYEIVKHFNWKGPVGCGFPAAIKDGIVLNASNIHKSWIGKDAKRLFEKSCGCPVNVLNDADAACLAEVKFGAGKDFNGLIFLVTIGTGIGTAIFYNGTLIPNTELGHIEIKGKDAEKFASVSAKKKKNLSMKKWISRFNKFLVRINKLFYPDLIILGGGISKNLEGYLDCFTVSTKVVTAKLKNEAGIIGAAISARNLLKS